MYNAYQMAGAGCRAAGGEVLVVVVPPKMLPLFNKNKTEESRAGSRDGKAELNF